MKTALILTAGVLGGFALARHSVQRSQCCATVADAIGDKIEGAIGGPLGGFVRTFADRLGLTSVAAGFV